MPNNTQPLKKVPKNAMEKILFDLTGQGGLYSRFYGDYPYSTGNPQLALFGAPEQYAGGIVDPIAKAGYISPANNTYTACVTTAVATESIVTSTIVDEENKFAFLYTAFGVLHRTESLTDTTFSATTISVSSTAGTDLAFYSTAGIRKLFYAYSNGSLGGSTSGDIGIWDLSGLSGGGINGNTLFIGYTNLAGGQFVTGTSISGQTSGATAHVSANYNIGQQGFRFTVSSANATTSATYTNNGNTFTVEATISSGTTLTTRGTGLPATSGTLTKTSGTGDSTITFSAYIVDSTLAALSTNPSGLLYLTSITGTFTAGETINAGGMATATAFLSGAGSHNSTVISNFMSTYVASPASTFGSQAGITTTGGFTRMIVADNGYMYILDGPFVHKYDGTDGAGAATLGVSGAIADSYQAFGIITPGVLEFPPQFTLTDALDLRGSLWITLLRSQENIFPTVPPAAIYEVYNGVYIWDRETEGTSTTDFIEVPGCREIRAIVSFQGVATLFTVSSTGYAQIRMWNGSDFKIVTQLGQSAYPDFHDSISINGDSMVWLGADGQMYSYGKINPSVKSNSLYQIGNAAVNITNTSSLQYGGAIVLANANQSVSITGENQNPEGYYLGLLDSINAKILKWFPHSVNVNNTQQQAATGNFFSMVMSLPKLSQTHYLTLFYPSIGSGGATTLINFNIYLNQSTTPWNASPIAITQDDALRGYKTIPVHVHGVNFIQIGWTYPTNTSISAIPTPSFATVDYTPTTQIL